MRRKNSLTAVIDLLVTKNIPFSCEIKKDSIKIHCQTDEKPEDPGILSHDPQAKYPLEWT